MEAVLLIALFSNSLRLDVKLATGITSSFFGLGQFHCCNLSVHVRNSGT